MLYSSNPSVVREYEQSAYSCIVVVSGILGSRLDGSRTRVYKSRRHLARTIGRFPGPAEMPVRCTDTFISTSMQIKLGRA